MDGSTMEHLFLTYVFSTCHEIDDGALVSVPLKFLLLLLFSGGLVVVSPSTKMAKKVVIGVTVVIFYHTSQTRLFFNGNNFGSCSNIDQVPMNILGVTAVDSARHATMRHHGAGFGAALVTMAVVLNEYSEEYHFSRKSICRGDDNNGHEILLCNPTKNAKCEAASPPASSFQEHRGSVVNPPSWVRRNLLAPIGIPLPVPRLVTRNDPALTLAHRYQQRRLRDEARMRKLLENTLTTTSTSQSVTKQDPEAIKALQQQLCEITFGKGVTAQAREDFLLQYGCTGWTDEVLDVLVDLCETRGMVEIGAGHGQWARVLTEAYQARQDNIGNDKNNDTQYQQARKKKKQFDFCLAYDDMSNLPLNVHIYNPYTQPHHDYFGNVQMLEPGKLPRLLQSWACRGRALLLVYPPPGNMALAIVQQYVDAAPENDTIIFVGEGRGGANGDDALFDYFERGDWILLQVLEVKKPPGDKGYEKLFIFQRTTSSNHPV